MNKSLFVVALASVAMASCSKDEQPRASVDSDVITLKSSVLSVRGTDIDDSNLSSLYVTAFDTKDAVFFGETVFNREGTTNSFKSNPEHRWPGDGSKVRFYCYAPAAADLGGTVSLKAGEKSLADFSPKSDIKSQTDFVAACAEGTKGDGNGVNVAMNHQLTQIKIAAKCDNKTYTCKITGVKIGRPVSKASFTFPAVGAAAGVWTPSTVETDKENYKAEFATAVELNANPQSIMDANGSAMLIPQTLVAWDSTNNPKNEAGAGKTRGAYIAVKLLATSTAGKVLFDGWSAVPVPTNTVWEAGKSYTYTLDYTNGLGKVDPEEPHSPDTPEPGEDILGGNVSFKVTVTPWASENRDIDVK